MTHSTTVMFIQLPTGPSTSSQPAQQQPKNSQCCSLAPTPSSQPPSTDFSSLCSPQLSPQILPPPQLSDLPADGHPKEGSKPATTLAPPCVPQRSSSGGVQEVKESKDAKGSKKQHLHCPTCKVTVNSSSQLEAHCSGAYSNTSDINS